MDQPWLSRSRLVVVELPMSIRLDSLKGGMSLAEQVQTLFAARRQETERPQRVLEADKGLLDKALAKG